MSPKADVSQQRKSLILDAAMEIYSEVGLPKARMADFAQRSGLSKSSLDLYFQSKNNLILTLHGRVFEPEIKDLRSLLELEMSIEQRRLLDAERSAKGIITMLKWMPLMYDFIALAFRQNQVRKAISRFYQQNMATLESLIQQGIDSGEFPLTSARDAAIAFGSILEGTLVLWFYDPDEIEIKTHLMNNIKLLIRGLKPARKDHSQ